MSSKILWGVGLIILGAAFLTAASPFAVVGSGNAEGSFDRTLTVTGPVDLDVATGAGAIAVTAGQGGTVHVLAHIKARGHGSLSAEEQVKRLQQNPPIEQNGNSIRIGQINDDDLKRDVTISYDLVVPADTRLNSTTGSGSQSIADVKGPVHATTGSGSVTVRNTGTDVRLQTGSGGITATQVSGAAVLQTGSGSIHLEQTAPGDVRAQTGSGSVDLKGIAGGLRAQTGSGHVTITGAPTADWSIQTGSGGIDLSVPGNANFNVDARAGSGGVSVDLPVTVEGSIRRGELHGKVGSGGPTVELRTGSGAIELRKSGI